MNTKSNINKTIHAPIITRFVAFHMQDSGQCSINTESVVRIDERLVCKSYTDSDIVKIEEKATLSEILLKMILTCELLLKAGHKSRELTLA